jgi:hypothetical protein
MALGFLSGQLFGCRFAFLVFRRNFGEQLLGRLADVLFIGKPFRRLFRVTAFRMTFSTNDGLLTVQLTT